MNIVVLGAGGMLGHVVTLVFKEQYKERVIACARRLTGRVSFDQYLTLVDLRDFQAVDDLLRRWRPCCVVNCAAVTDAHAPREEMIRINAQLPQVIAKILNEGNDQSRLIHISTNGVFQGDQGGYTENHRPDALDPYGQSKQSGEVLDSPHLTLRTSLIGWDPFQSKGLLNWFLRQTGSVQGYDRVYWNGITTLELARFIQRCMKDPLTGLIHLASQRISKYELLAMIKALYAVPVHIERVGEPIQDLTLQSIRTDVKFSSINFKDALQEFKAWYERSICFDSWSCIRNR